jgi:hypothetical protein
MEIVMQNKDNTALAAAINSFAEMAFELLGVLADGMSPACQGARLLLQGDGVDFVALRQAMNALALLKASTPVAAPEVAAPTVVDVATIAALVKEQVAALVKEQVAALDLRKVASEAALAAFEAADLDLDDLARAVIKDAVDNVDFDDLVRDVIKDKIDDEFNFDVDEAASEIVKDKVDNDFNFDVDEAASEMVKDKIEEDLDIERFAERIIRDLLANKPLTITLKG